LEGTIPKLTQLTRNHTPKDSSIHLLPRPAKSNFFSRANFFFLVGAPFIDKIEAENKKVFEDAQGNPELRFESSVTENTLYLLSSVYAIKNGPVKISYGPPLSSYESGPQEVHGIGSLIHEFTNRIPVLFLTEAGLVPAHLISVTLKVVPENLGCISDQPNAIFSCAKDIGKDEILAVYIPYGSVQPSSFKIKRLAHNVWTADLNNDGIPDLAFVSDTFMGASSDAMVEAIWYINSIGNWEIIDWAMELDCT